MNIEPLNYFATAGTIIPKQGLKKSGELVRNSNCTNTYSSITNYHSTTIHGNQYNVDDYYNYQVR